MTRINTTITGFATINVVITSPDYKHINVVEALNNNDIAISVLDAKEVIETKTYQKIGYVEIKESDISYQDFVSADQTAFC